MIKQYRKSREWEEGNLLEKGFTLIELLIVIVVLGILAATVIFALGGVTTSSAQASCNSDAKSMEVAVEAYHAFPGNNDAWPATMAVLTTNAGGGPYLRTLPTTNHYQISIDATGGVYVNAKAPATITQNTTTSYDSSTNPCTTSAT